MHTASLSARALYVVCEANGKAPIGHLWGKHALTAEQIAQRRANNPNINVGIILGPMTGVIDVECDSPEAEANAKAHFGDSLDDGPGWPSKRGKHRLRAWDDRLAELPSVVKIDGIEFRLGTKQSQSICPPSIVDGVERKWTKSIDDHEPPPLPEHVVELLLKHKIAAIDNTPDELLGDLGLQSAAVKRWQTLFERRNIAVNISPRDKLGRIWLRLPHCPFKPHDHASDGDPALIVNADGSVGWACRHANCAEKRAADVEAILGDEPVERKGRLPRINLFDMPTAYPRDPEDVIKGWLQCGEVAGIVGGPKSYKSYWLLQLALSVAAGRSFLGHDTVQGPVAYFDNELRPRAIIKRAMWMADAMCIDWTTVARSIDIFPLRGRLADVNAIEQELSADPIQYRLVVLDAWYKMMPRTADENSNSDVTNALVILDRASEQNNCGIAYAHHLSKGDQSRKAVTDLGSGAGSQARSVDAHFAMLPHEDENTVVFQGVLRNQPPFKPMTLEFRHPLWHVVDKDPTAIASPGKKRVPTLAEFVATIPITSAKRCETLLQSRHILGASETTIKRLFGEAEQQGLIVVEQPANRRDASTIRRKAAA